MVWDAIMRICRRSSVLGWVRGIYGDNIRKGEIANYDFYVRVGAFREDGVR